MEEEAAGMEPRARQLGCGASGVPPLKDLQPPPTPGLWVSTEFKFRPYFS